MFRQLAKNIPEDANSLFLQHPSVLMTSLEVAWQSRMHSATQPLGHPVHRSNLPQLPDSWLKVLKSATTPQIKPPTGQSLSNDTVITSGLRGGGHVLWDHLIYAYMIENTRIYEVFRRVLQEFLHGEKFGVPTAAAQHWLRNTEELFYRDPPPFSMIAINSHIRPDMRSSRRNAYWRMFGMDLNHGADDGQPYSYVKAEAHNNDFVRAFEEFLHEAWVAISNRHNNSGSSPTDAGKLENLVANLQNMLLSRRKNGNLSREEFAFVSMMSWFHLTVEFDSPIIEALRAEANGPEQRLFKVAQRAGVPAHGLSKSFFDIANPISKILILIETSDASDIVTDIVATANAGDPLNELQRTVNTIITHWSIITGREVKARKVATT